jgi:hypothetical protein
MLESVLAKPILYVAGPYRSERGEYFVRQNIRAAEEVALQVWSLGAVALCPHKNTAGFGGYLPDPVWLHGDLILLSVCQGLVLVPNWSLSAGTRVEVAWALEHSLPVFQWPQDRERLTEFIVTWEPMTIP